MLEYFPEWNICPKRNPSTINFFLICSHCLFDTPDTEVSDLRVPIRNRVCFLRVCVWICVYVYFFLCMCIYTRGVLSVCIYAFACACVCAYRKWLKKEGSGATCYHRASEEMRRNHPLPHRALLIWSERACACVFVCESPNVCTHTNTCLHVAIWRKKSQESVY